MWQPEELVPSVIGHATGLSAPVVSSGGRPDVAPSGRRPARAAPGVGGRSTKGIFGGHGKAWNLEVQVCKRALPWSCRAKRPALQQEPNVQFEPKWLRCPHMCICLGLADEVEDFLYKKKKSTYTSCIYAFVLRQCKS